MSKTVNLMIATVALLGTVSVASAQTTQDHTVHHPDASAQAGAPAAPMPMPSPGGAAGAMPMMDMSKMMGGDMQPMMRMMQGGGMAMMPMDHIEGRIAFFKVELGITDAQLPQWNAVADALRGSAASMRTAMVGMMKAGMPTTAPARLEAMVQMMSARLDVMRTMLAAAKPLYGVLSDPQKKTADELMAPRAMGMPAKRMGE